MKLLNSNSRQLQFSRAFERISQVQTRLWLVICAIIIANIAAALAFRYWPAASEAAGIIRPAQKAAAAESPEEKAAAPEPLTIPTNEEATETTELPAIAEVTDEATSAETAIEEKVESVSEDSKKVQDAATTLETVSENVVTEVAVDSEEALTKTEDAAPADTTPQPAPTQDDTANLPDFAGVFVEISHILLPVLRVVALLCAIMLAGTISLALKLSLLGRLGAADKLTSAFVWSMMLICVLVPWSSAFDGFPLPAATMLAGEIITATNSALAVDADWTNAVLYFSRVVAYPALALILAFAIQLQWFRARGPIDDTITKHIRDDEDEPVEQPVTKGEAK